MKKYKLEVIWYDPNGDVGVGDYEIEITHTGYGIASVQSIEEFEDEDE